MIFNLLLAAFTLFLIAVLVWAWRLYRKPRWERRQVDALEVLWALEADEPVFSIAREEF